MTDQLDIIMAQMGFTPSDTGPYVTELRAAMAKKVEAFRLGGNR